MQEFREFRRINEVVSFVFSRDNRCLVCGTANKLFMYDIETGARYTSKENDGASMLDISASGRLVVSCLDRTIAVWWLPEFKQRIKWRDPACGSVIVVKLIQYQTSGPPFVLAGYMNCKISIVNLEGFTIKRFIGHNSPIMDIAVFACINRFAAISANARVKIWDYESGECIGKMRVSDVKYANQALALTKDCRTLAVGTWSGTIVMCDPILMKVVRKLEVHNRSIAALAFNHDDSIMASTSNDLTIRLWHLASGECFQTMIIPTMLGVSSALCFSWDGRMLATSEAGWGKTPRNMQLHATVRGLIPGFYTFQVWSLCHQPLQRIIPRVVVQLVGMYMFEAMKQVKMTDF
jgi:WD40 repeat protein